jgi:predicted membrane protein
VCWEFWTRENSIGRFKPLPDAAAIDRAWLHEHVFKFRPEVIGAAWDDRTGAPEVAAVIARMVQEGKLDSRVVKVGRKGSDLILTLLRPKESFDGYEAALVKALFFDGTTTSTAKIKAHYKNRGFDPVAKVRDPLQGGIRDMAGKRDALKVDRRMTVALAIPGAVGLTLGGFASTLNLLGALVTSCIVVAFYVAGLFGAIDYRRRVSRLGLSSVEFVPAALLILAVPALLLLGVGGFRFNTLVLQGLVGASLAAIRSLFNLARSRDGASRLENRRNLAAARDFFARELRRPVPALDDAWFPYFLAFGLDSEADRWFRSFGGTAGTVSPAAATIGSYPLGSRSSSPDVESSSSSGGSWTGAM